MDSSLHAEGPALLLWAFRPGHLDGALPPLSSVSSTGCYGAPSGCRAAWWRAATRGGWQNLDRVTQRSSSILSGRRAGSSEKSSSGERWGQGADADRVG